MPVVRVISFDRLIGCCHFEAHGLTAHGSRLTAHGSRFKAHGSRFKAQGSKTIL
jgi:hypothetical protein